MCSYTYRYSEHFYVTLLLKAISFPCCLTAQLLLSSMDECLGINFPEVAFLSLVSCKNQLCSLFKMSNLQTLPVVLFPLVSLKLSCNLV